MISTVTEIQGAKIHIDDFGDTLTIHEKRGDGVVFDVGAYGIKKLMDVLLWEFKHYYADDLVKMLRDPDFADLVKRLKED